MFAKYSDPSFAGKLERLAPLAAMFAITLAFILGLVLVVSSVTPAQPRCIPSDSRSCG